MTPQSVKFSLFSLKRSTLSSQTENTSMQQKYIKMRLRLYRYFQLGGSLIPSLTTNLWNFALLTGGKPGKIGYINLPVIRVPPPN